MSDIERRGWATFDAIRQTDEHGVEFWSARDLMPRLGYEQWRRFEQAIERARQTAINSGLDAHEHFAGADKINDLGYRHGDYRLTRYGAYLVAMNGDPRKDEIAAAQTYFAVRTREAETAQVPAQLTRREMAAYWLDAETRAEAAEARADQLAPAAQSWQALSEAEGDYSLREAAQILDRDPWITTGQNRLAKYLRTIGWVDSRGRSYQRNVDCGRLVMRTITYDHPHTGEPQLSTQLRVTPKGLHELHRLLGGAVAPRFNHRRLA